MRVYVIGNEDAVLGFSLVGVRGEVARNADETNQALDRALADSTIGLVLVSEDVARWARERIDRLKTSSLSPLVVEVPGLVKDQNAPALRDFVQRAVGVHLGDTHG